jgi:hypothetical protein
MTTPLSGTSRAVQSPGQIDSRSALPLANRSGYPAKMARRNAVSEAAHGDVAFTAAAAPRARDRGDMTHMRRNCDSCCAASRSSTSRAAWRNQ